MDKILGLEYGADDYITKPFNILEGKGTYQSDYETCEEAGAEGREGESSSGGKSEAGTVRAAVCLLTQKRLI